jgi:predicted pyridoxine 5'-phosphate oxidase superfamily flavin-nucleotide-binding protein
MNLQNQTKQIVLLWLATSDSSGEPNVSPKELFLFKGKDRLIVANIASPKTLTNILQNPKVCISGIDIWKQKGMQYKGRAKVISPLNKRFKKIEAEFSTSLKFKYSNKKKSVHPAIFSIPQRKKKIK